MMCYSLFASWLAIGIQEAPPEVTLFQLFPLSGEGSVRQKLKSKLLRVVSAPMHIKHQLQKGAALIQIVLV